MTNKAPKIVAIIPARSGSKRVKNKNIRLLGGKPLIAYTIEAAQRAKLIDMIILSTDSKEIAQVAREFGLTVPFLRPKAIAQDHSTEYQYYAHALDWLKKEAGFEPEIIVNLFPTSPFRQSETIDRAISHLLNHPEADSLRSMKKVGEHPYKMWRLFGDYAEPFVPSKNNNIHTLSYHLLPEVYIQNASIYIIRTEAFHLHKATVGDRVLHFIMDPEESIDINTEQDFSIAEAVLKNKSQS